MSKSKWIQWSNMLKFLILDFFIIQVFYLIYLNYFHQHNYPKKIRTAITRDGRPIKNLLAIYLTDLQFRPVILTGWINRLHFWPLTGKPVKFRLKLTGRPFLTTTITIKWWFRKWIKWHEDKIWNPNVGTLKRTINGHTYSV